MLICLQLSVLGGRVESVRVTTCDGKEWKLNGEPIKHRLIVLVEGILGNSFQDDEIEKAIRRWWNIQR